MTRRLGTHTQGLSPQPRASVTCGSEHAQESSLPAGRAGRRRTLGGSKQGAQHHPVGKDKDGGQNQEGGLGVRRSGHVGGRHRRQNGRTW